MRELPILFSSEMVKAILEGRKTQTRRVIIPQPPEIWDFVKPIKNNEVNIISWCFYNSKDSDFHGYKNSKYQIGDRLYVRENYRLVCYPYHDGKYIYGEALLEYLADGDEFVCPADYEEWWKETWRKHSSDIRPNIFMPKWAARIWLEFTGIRVERLQDISEEDAKKEGASLIGWDIKYKETFHYPSYKASFKQLWESINAKRGFPWELNPWIWVYEFKRIK
jgi:hypothetical protein